MSAKSSGLFDPAATPGPKRRGQLERRADRWPAGGALALAAPVAEMRDSAGMSFALCPPRRADLLPAIFGGARVLDFGLDRF